MPELPEVEVTRRLLAPFLIERRIDRVRVTQPSYFFLTPPRTLSRKLMGRTVLALERQGKYLLARLDDGSRLLLHLGMTGQLFSSLAASPRLLSSTARASLAPEAQAQFKPDEHTHLWLSFSDGEPDVYFRDVRKFGKVRLLEPGETDPRLLRLGPDALTVNPSLLAGAALRRRGPIKSFLLDQSVIAGVGNIYADEALHRARVHPTRTVDKLQKRDWQRVSEALLSVLLRSIETGGSSISDYVRPDGADGGYQDERRVYGREALPCLTCGTAIARIVIGARGTWFCERCQKR